MNKIDKRISYKIVMDTETCPLDKDLEDVNPKNMWVYDIGWAIVDKRGNVYRTRSFINADIYITEKTLMKSAYYADKIPQYEADIKTGKRKLAKLETIKKIFFEDVAEFNVSEVYAHNAYFDYTAMQNTQRWVTKSKYRYFFPKDVTICDTLKMARQTIGKMPTYKRFCKDNGFVTKNGLPRFTAEILYKFITRDLDFTEAHTGLEDVMIEKEILRYCYKQHKPMQKKLFTNDKKSA